MSGLRADMSGKHWICSGKDRICRDYEQRKSKPGANTINLGPDKLTNSKTL
jgi:hypothetical protein